MRAPMQNLVEDATLIASLRSWARHPLSRFDRWLAGLGMMSAVLVLTVAAAVLAVLIASAGWLATFGQLPWSIPLLAGVVAALVAWPIILHSQKLIKSLDRKKRELTGLTVALARSRDEAEASARSKTTFLANMSHELRTPLHAIIGFSELIRDERNGPIGPRPYVDYATDIHESGRRLLDIINSVLEFSKLEAGAMVAEAEPVDLAAVIATCLAELADEVARASIAIDSRAASVKTEVVADPRLVKRILFNTLSNAIKFNRPGGRVAVELALAAGGATVTIADTGIGMARDEISTALRPFHQIDSTLDRRFNGTGLGLPLAKALIEHQGGRLTIDSTPDVGTTLTLRFPAVSSH